LISFDNLPSIATNQVNAHDPLQGTDTGKECLNTIDAGSPSSEVLNLPETMPMRRFQVAWGGSDDQEGSGIATYDIYVSRDSGLYTAWVRGATETSGIFVGEVGSTYAFYSVATDNVGNREPDSESADTFAAITSEPESTPTVTPPPTVPLTTNIEGSEWMLYL
jgi:hypothetical protein